MLDDDWLHDEAVQRASVQASVRRVQRKWANVASPSAVVVKRNSTLHVFEGQQAHDLMEVGNDAV